MSNKKLIIISIVISFFLFVIIFGIIFFYLNKDVKGNKKYYLNIDKNKVIENPSKEDVKNLIDQVYSKSAFQKFENFQ